MSLSDTEQRILEYLVEKNTYATAREISIYMGVSTKTIYRGIKNLRELLDEDIIESDRSKGYRLNYEKYLSILNESHSFNSQYMSVENRRMSILLNLLTHSPKQISISDLSLQYFVSQSSIVNDLEFIQKELKKTNLKLSKTNSGTSITGLERDVRKELMHKVNRFLMNSETPALNGLTMKDNSTQYLTTQFDKSEVFEMKVILESASRLLGFVIENPYYINLLTHLLILLRRNKSDLDVNEVEYDINELNEDKYLVAKYIINNMEINFNIEINPREVNYVYAFLISTRKNIKETQDQQTDKVKIQSTKEVVHFVNEIIYRMEESLNIEFSNDLTLKKSLLQHVQPMLNRVKYNIIIVNPLIEDIKDNLSNTFYKVKKVVQKTCRKYKIKKISDDEIGYLAVYFQNTIEKVIKQLDILIVCTTGIGTSHLLKTRVSNNFPMLNIKGIISTNEVSEYNQSNIDFILTTVNLPPTKVPQLLIGALLDKGDINIIKQFIKKNYGSLI